MKNVTPIFQTQHGSLLYGTNTPKSDVDLKGVHLPSARAILLQRVRSSEDVIDRKVKLSDGLKNSAGDVDDQSFSLANYLMMVSKGDTNAIELLFAPDRNVTLKTPLWDEVRALGRKTINRKCRGFVGYVQRQVSTYSVKGGRLATVQAVVDTLRIAVDENGTKAKMETIMPVLTALVEGHEFCTFEIILSQGREINHFVCVDRKMPMAATIKFGLDLMSKVLAEYGERARKAMQNDNVDWKAVSHAVRIAEEAKELLQDGVITFPRPNAVELLQIKNGELNYDAMGERIQQAVIDVETLSLTSSLPEESDMGAVDSFVLEQHLSQIR